MLLFVVSGSKDFVEKKVFNCGYIDGYNSSSNRNSPYASLDLRLFANRGKLEGG